MRPKHPVIDLLKVRTVQGFTWLLSILSLRAGHCLAAIVGYCWSLRKHSRTARVTRINLAQCFVSGSQHTQQHLYRKSLINTAQTAIEIAQAWYWPHDKTLAHIKAVKNEVLLDEALASKKGVIILAPHLGNWEWLGIYLTTKTAVTSLYEPPKIPALDQWLRARRANSVGRSVPATRSGIVALYKVLNQGGCVGILPDQEPELSNGVFTPFFGVPTLTMTLASRLAHKTGAVVICAYATRLPHSQGFEIVFKKPDERIYSADLAESAQALNEVVEACVREAPEQYQWEYKRFKRRPKGETNIYPRDKVIKKRQ
jgi:KDO2-lipid IV(A) lauroyltransferase